MKLLVQRDSFQCGPIALYNAMALLGLRPPPLKEIRKLARCTVADGTEVRDLCLAARALGLRLDWSKRRKPGKVYIAIVSLRDNDHYVTVSDKGVHNASTWDARRCFHTSKKPLKVTDGFLFEVTKVEEE